MGIQQSLVGILAWDRLQGMKGQRKIKTWAPGRPRRGPLTGVWVRVDLAARLKEVAKAQGRTVADYAGELIQQHLDKPREFDIVPMPTLIDAPFFGTPRAERDEAQFKSELRSMDGQLEPS